MLKGTIFMYYKYPYIVGLYRTSRPVQKSGKVSKSGLSGNRTFSFPDAGLLTLTHMPSPVELYEYYIGCFKNIQNNLT